MLDARQVLVTIGTPCSMSAIGSTETHRATVLGAPAQIGFAAFDAGLVDIDLERSRAAEPVFVHVTGDKAGRPITIAEIEQSFGAVLRANMGIRQVPRSRVAEHVLTDVAA